MRDDFDSSVEGWNNLISNATLATRIQKSQSLAALASYFQSDVAVSDASLRFLPRTPPVPQIGNQPLTSNEISFHLGAGFRNEDERFD
jgi:hypothetical protein